MKKWNLLLMLIPGSILIISVISILVLPKNKMFQESSEVNNLLAANWDKSKVTEYVDVDGAKVPVPNGYVVSGITSERTVKTGVVIYEGIENVTTSPTSGSTVFTSSQATRNQWVWVPVSDVSRIYEEINGVKKAKLWSYSSTGRIQRTNNNYEPGILTAYDSEYFFSRYNLLGLTRDEFYQKLQVEFEETIKSIEKYGGFYIGRYETGNLSQKIPVVRKMNTDVAKQSWYLAYSKMQYLVQNSNLHSNIIWGCLWDETLQWFIESGNKKYEEIATDSGGWGNYKDSTFPYINESGNIVTKPVGTTRIPTGSSEYTKANNIYDMAGNLRECTLEAYGTSYRPSRGGYSYADTGTSNPVSGFVNYNPIFDTATHMGFRAYFYIK